MKHVHTDEAQSSRGVSASPHDTECQSDPSSTERHPTGNGTCRTGRRLFHGMKMDPCVVSGSVSWLQLERNSRHASGSPHLEHLNRCSVIRGVASASSASTTDRGYDEAAVSREQQVLTMTLCASKTETSWNISPGTRTNSGTIRPTIANMAMRPCCGSICPWYTRRTWGIGGGHIRQERGGGFRVPGNFTKPRGSALNTVSTSPINSSCTKKGLDTHSC